MPVVQDTARIVWPNGNDTQSVNAPLTGYWAQELRADIPCATVLSLDERSSGPALLFATVPEARFDEGAGMHLQIDNGTLIASNRAQQVARQPLPPEGCDIRITSDVHRTELTVAGTPIYTGQGDVRPRVVGIYTEIDETKDEVDGLDVSITPDTRYQSSPTGWKIAVGALGVAALIGCLIVVNRMDRRGARRAPRWAPVGWWKLTKRDATVFAALGAWVFIGPVTSDDGYILTMARVTEDAGYLPNYHRWFGVAEAPFGWFYHVYQLMGHVSVAPPWIRLPAFVLGVVSWLLISREVMPRLGKLVRTSRAAGWAAAAVFLVWWLPFNTGTRPEPVAAVGSLIALCAVERALVTRRLLPVCLGLLAAALTLAATPTGLIAVAPFLVAGRPLFQLLRQRARTVGWLPVLAPILGAGLLVLVVVFADQTLASVQEATRLRAQVGPNLSWFEELSRYQLLFSNSADGSAARRFPVLLLLLCTGACLVVLLRRGRIQGAALGPSRRLIGTVALFFLLLALTPTKWTHHFGAFAAVGAAMAALTALATSSTVLRSNRNRAAFLAGLLVVAALAMTGPNSYWFVSNLGVPWAGVAPSIGGFALSNILLIAAGIAAVVAFIENVRAQRSDLLPGAQERRGYSLKMASVSFVVVCGLVAAGEFASMTMAIYQQRDSYSLGAANIDHVFGSGCNLSDHVMVENEPVSSMLTELPSDQQNTVDEKKEQPQQENNPLPPPEEDNGRVQTGFRTEPADPEDPIDEPPHGFTRDAVRMWSSYRNPDTPVGKLRTNWYSVPRENREGRQAVISVASPPFKATRVVMEWGQITDEGVKVVRTNQVYGPGGPGFWQDVRFNLRDLPPEVDAMRIFAADDDFTEDGWVAVTGPRVPTFTTLTERIGKTPVYIDWPASFVYPCLNPMKMRDGIAELPKYRITAGALAFEGDVGGNAGGGPNGFLEEVAEQPDVPSYLIGQPDQSWGQLKQLEPYTNGRKPTVIHGSEVRPGWWSPGPGPEQPDGRQPTR
ncbi:arabinosyltransferase domain-containing protein [Amycolatopsis suaedae]|nr:arabinosyltransferase domain-containing protein [Amycolatopsis suaedae]